MIWLIIIKKPGNIQVSNFQKSVFYKKLSSFKMCQVVLEDKKKLTSFSNKKKLQKIMSNNHIVLMNRKDLMTPKFINDLESSGYKRHSVTIVYTLILVFWLPSLTSIHTFWILTNPSRTCLSNPTLSCLLKDCDKFLDNNCITPV